MPFKFNKLLRAILAGSPYIAQPPSGPVTYGATADAGEVNTSDVLTGTRYWFNYSTGNNINTGQVEALPAQTLVKLYDYAVAGGSLTAPRGSGFMLARGDTWDGFIQGSNTDGTFYGNYLYGASGTGARPVIKYKQSAAQFGGNTAGMFFNRAGTTVKNVKLDGQYSFTATAASIVGTFAEGDVITGVSSGALGVFTYNSAGTFQLSCTSYPTMFTSGETITADVSKSATISAFGYVTGVILRDGSGGRVISGCEITNTLGIGVHLSSSGSAVTNDTVTNCVISNACRLQTTGAGIDGGGSSNNTYNSSGLTITDNTIFDCGISSLAHNMYLNNFGTSVISGNWSYMTSNVGNHALVIHGICDTVTINNNLFEWCNNGLGINDGGYGNAEVFNNFTIHSNLIRYHGRRSGQTQGQAMELACLTNSVVYNNISHDCDGVYSLAGRRVSPSVYTNVVTISHETIYDCTDTFESFKISGSVTAVVIQNCIIMCTHATSKLVTVDATAASQVTFRNCIFWAPNNAGSPISWNGSNYTIDAFLALAAITGRGNLKVDPLFTNAATGDFTLQAGSPAKLAGYNSGIATDFGGNARHPTTPSIGAYE